MVDDFVSKQKSKAKEAYELLYGDGFGIDGEAPPKREAFEENYIVEALNRETKRIMEAKGYAQESSAASTGVDRESLKEVEKKDAPTTLEGEVERLAVQKRQRRLVRERVREGKRLEILESLLGTSERTGGSAPAIWELGCGESLYREHVYGSIAGCSPGPPSGPPCRRMVFDDFATDREQQAMIDMIDHSFEGLYHQGAETLLVPERDSRHRMGDEGYKLTEQLLERVRSKIAEALNISRIFYSGSLLKRMDWPPLPGEFQIEEEHDSWNPHVDKANIASYDWSALLYFNSIDEAFGGGELVFNDPDADRLVRPLRGRLLVFSSGLENLHRVMPMSWGSRYVLSMWFTCSEVHAHANLGSGDGAAHSEEL